MFKIRRIYDDILPANKRVISAVKEILADRFNGIDRAERDKLGEKLRDPMKHRFRTVLYAAEGTRKNILGFALVMHEPLIGFFYLDYLASELISKNRGIGGALYSYIRGDARRAGVKGIFFECLPDVREQCESEEMLRQNRARLRFYEQFGARPIIGTEYQKPINPGDTCMPFLVYDDPTSSFTLRRDFTRNVVQAILERKYSALCSPEYTKTVVDSIVDDPVKLRDFRYKARANGAHVPLVESAEKVSLAVTDIHVIHHVRDRGYVEAPVRVSRIMSALNLVNDFKEIKIKSFPLSRIKEVHDPDFVDYIRRVCKNTDDGHSVYPYVFPIRNQARPPKELPLRAGYYCIDTFTPLNNSALLAARRAVDCTLTAAEAILEGSRVAYSLVRPPGHHAEKRSYGGFCYFNNNAIATKLLSQYGKVAVLDIDYHHGNGQQSIFYNDSNVFTVSIHGHPDFAYPYFTGFEDERGIDGGEGFNMNLPLPEKVDGARYLKALKRAIRAIADFDPVFLVVPLGLDTAKGDPTGSWVLTAADFNNVGAMIAELDLPTLVVQEGGYRTKTLGVNVASFFKGLTGAKLQKNK